MEDEKCFNCDIPVEYCTGEPKTCRKAYEKALSKQAVQKKPVIAPPRKLMSEKYKKWGQSYYQRRKQSGVCTQCGKRPAVRGLVLCEDCEQKAILRMQKRKAEKADDIRQKAKDKYNRCIKDGICPYCGKRPAMIGYVACEACRKRLKETQRKYQKRKRGKEKNDNSR
ncbi:MAG: hypothetical protein LUD27_01910 [Clostridia bacterium]|nr:hypothetical protein [Clostridia bacterium]